MILMMTKFSLIVIFYLLMMVNYSNSSALSARNKQTTVVTNFIIFIILWALLNLIFKNADLYLILFMYFISEFHRPLRHRCWPLCLEGLEFLWLKLIWMRRNRHLLQQTQQLIKRVFLYFWFIRFKFAIFSMINNDDWYLNFCKDDVSGLHNESSISSRIIAGTVVTSPTEFPWQAYLGMGNGNNAGFSSFCGGTLIDSQWVLTAAHCLDAGYKLYTDKWLTNDNKIFIFVHWFYYYLISYQSVTVLLGARNVKSYNEPNRIVLKSNQFYLHPQYQKAVIKNDIALIRLPAPITFTSMCCVDFLNRSSVLFN
jgi:hypothetical protein